MKYKNKNDLIQHGPLYKVLLSLSTPLILSNLMQTLSDLSNTYWLGFLGKEEISASSFVWPVLFLFIAIGFGIYVAGASILAQLLGKGEEELAEKYAEHVVVITVFIGIVFTAIGYFLTPTVVRLMGAQSDFEHLAISFLQVSFLSFPFMAVYFSYQAILNAQGRTIEMMVANGLSLLVNVVVAPFFIFDTIPIFGLQGLGLGIDGAAAASIVSKAFLLVLGFLLVKRYSAIRLELTKIKFVFDYIKEILSVAFPAMLGQGGAAIGFIILHSAIGSYGTDTIFAFALINRITGIFFMPAMGIGGALTSVVGQNLGAGSLERVIEAFKKANVMSFIITGLGSLFLIFYYDPVIKLFLDPKAGQNALDLCRIYMFYSIPIIPLMGMFSIFQGLFQGSGYTHYSMYMEVGRLWALRLPMILLFKHFSNLGSTGIWISMTTSNLLIILYGFWLYNKKGWTKPRILSH
ncbi:MATE family efflux transporter [Guggenheimella bovis]